jgi:hypothetical protein
MVVSGGCLYVFAQKIIERYSAGVGEREDTVELQIY